MADKPIFIGDHTALDFLNSVAAPRGEVIDSLRNGDSYVHWLVVAGLLDPSEAKTLLLEFRNAGLDLVASEARDLREWFRQVVARPAIEAANGPEGEAISKLNRILAIDCVHRRLEASGKDLVLRERRALTQVRQLLVPVAQAMAELVSDARRCLVRRCANSGCTLWFYDRTKARRRRFCSAAVCGNRAKVAAFRERRRQGLGKGQPC